MPSAHSTGKTPFSTVFLLLSVVLAILAPGALWGQSAIPNDANNYLAVTGATANGDPDGLQVVFFRIPRTENSRLYFAAYDPDLNDADTANNEQLNPPDFDDGGGAPVSTTFYLVGGEGAYTNPLSRQTDFSLGNGLADALIGSGQLGSTAYTRNTFPQQWQYFASALPADGEEVGDYIYFKVVVSADANVQKNGFRLDVSLSDADNSAIVPVPGAQSFAYSWNLSLVQETRTYNLYPFIPENTTGNIVAFNFDADAQAGGIASLTLFDGSESTNAAIPASNSDVAQSGPLAISGPAETNRTWRYEIVEPAGAVYVNPAEFWVENQAGDPLAIFSSGFVETRFPDHVESSPAAVQTATGDVQRITHRVVSETGEVLPYIRTFRVTSDVGNAIVADSSGWTGTATFRDVSSDGAGLAWVEVSRGTAGDVNLSISDVDPFPEIVAHSGSTITFNDNPPPVLTGQNLLFVENQAMPVPPYLTLTITDSGINDLVAGNTLEISLPGSLSGLQFDTLHTPVASVQGGPTGVVGAAVWNGTTLEIPITFSLDIAGGEFIQIADVRFLDNPTPAGSGNLVLNEAAPPAFPTVNDVRTMTVASPSSVWDGDTDNDWETATNWVGDVLPGDGFDVLIPDTSAGSGRYPVLTATPANSVRNLRVVANARLTLGGFTITNTGTLVNEGLIFSDGTGPGLDFDTNTGTVRYTGGATLNVTTGGAQSYGNLEIQGGVFTTPGTLSSTGDFTLSGSSSLTLGADMSVSGDTTLSDADLNLDGFDFTQDGGTLIQNNNLGSVTSAGGSLILDGTVSIDMDDGGAVEALPNLVITGAVTLASDIALTGLLSITAGGSLDVSPANHGIELQGNWNVDAAATFTSRSGTVTFSGANVQNVATGGSDAAHDFTTIAFDKAGGSVSFTEALAVTSLSFPGALAFDLSMIGGASITNAVTFSNTGTLTIGDAAGDTSTFTSGLTATAPGSKSLAGTISSTDQDLNFGGNAVTLGDDTTINSGTGTVSLADANGAFILELISSASPSVGIVNVNSFDIDQITANFSTASSLTAGTLSVNNGAVDLSFTGGMSITNAVTFPNSGTLTIGDGAGDSSTFTGGLIATDPSGKSIAGNIEAAGTGVINLGGAATSVTANALLGDTSTGQITLAAVTLADGVTLTLGAGAATPITTGAIDNTTTANSSNLTINTTGAVSLGALGATQPMNVVTITQSGGTAFTGSVDAATVTLTDTTGTIDFQGLLTATALNTALQGYNLIIDGGASITNQVDFDNSGTLTIGDNLGDTSTFTGGLVATAPSSKSIAGNIEAAGTGVINLGGTATSVTANTLLGDTSTGQITLAAVTLADGVTLTLGAGAATPITTGAIDNTTTANSSNLTINTTDAVSLGALGTTQPMNVVTITQSGGTAFTGSVDAATVTLTDTTGLIDFQALLTAGTLNTAAQGYNLTIDGGATITNNVTFNNNGTLSIGDNVADTHSFAGGFTSAGPSGAPAISIYGDLDSTNADLSFGDADTDVRFYTNTTISSGTGTITLYDSQVDDATTLTLSGDEIDLLGGASSLSPGGGTAALILQASADGVTTGVGTGSGASLDLTTADLGAIAAGFSSVTIGRATSTAALTIVGGDILSNTTIQSGSGSINLTGSIGDAAGAINLTLDSSADIVFDNGSGIDVTGVISVDADNNIATVAAGDVVTIASNGGNINMTADADTSGAGGIDFSTDFTVNAGAGQVSLQANDNIDVTGLTSTYAAAGDAVSIDSTAGAVTDAGDTNTDISGGLVNITAFGSVGASGVGNEIETSAGSLNISSTNAGGIWINETDAVTLIDIDTANGLIAITAGAAIDAIDVTSLTDNDANDITLTAAAGNIEVDVINAGLAAGDVNLIADTAAGQSVTDADNNSLVTADVVTITARDSIGGAAGLDINTSAVSIDASSTELADAGDIWINESDAVTLSDIDTVAGDITIAAGGAITATDVVATGGLVSISGGGQVDAVLVTTTPDNDANDISISTTNGNINVTTVTAGTGAASDVSLTANTAPGQSVVDANGAAANITAEVLTITAQGSIGAAGAGNDLDTAAVSMDISSSNAGSIWINETDAVTLSDIDTANGLIAITAGGAVIATNVAATGGLVNIAGGGQVDAVLVTTTPDNDANDISISTTNGNINVTTVTAGTGAASDVTLTANTAAGQSVVDANGAAANITAEVLTITAQGSIGAAGAGNDLDTAAVSMDISSSNAGSIWINETDAVTLSDIDTANGLIAITAGAAIDAIDVTSLTDNDANDITLTASAGNIEVDVINAGLAAGDVNLIADTAAGQSVTDADNNSLVTGEVVTITARDSIGAAAGLDINTSAVSIDASSTEFADAGDIWINESDAVTLSDIDTVAGDITIAAGGAVIATNVAATGGLVNIAGGGQVDAVLVTTTPDNDANDISISTTNGNINVTTVTAGTGAASDVTLTANTAAGQSVVDANGAAANITAEVLTITAQGSIGAAGAGNDLDTAAVSMAISSSNAGGIWINETDAVTLIDIDTANGLIAITAGAAIDAIDVTSLTDNDANDITLTAAAGNIEVDVINAGLAAGDVNLIADTAAGQSVTDADNNSLVTAEVVTITARDSIGAAAGLDINTSAVSIDASSTELADAGDIWINESDAVTLSDIDTVAGDITIAAGGAVIATNVAATGGLVNIAGGGQVDAVLVTTTPDNDANDISISTTNGNINVTTVTAGTGAASDVTLTANTAAGQSVVDANGAAANITAEVLTITAQGSIGAAGAGNDLDTAAVSMDISSSNAGSIWINETDAVTLSDIDTANGLIAITAGAAIDAIDVTSLTDNDANDITLTASAGNIEVDVINAGLAAGDVNLIADTAAGQSVTDADNNSLVTGEVVTITARDSIGAAAGLDINTSAVSIDASSTEFADAGDIWINESDAVTLSDIDTVAGDITIAAGGAVIATNVAATGGLVNIAGGGQVDAVLVTTTPDNDANDISISTTNGNINVTTVTAGTGAASDVTLTANTAAGQSVVDANGAAANITAEVLTITAQGSIGAAGAGNDLDTAAVSMDISSSNAGDIWINETDAVTLTTIDTVAGDITITAGGAVNAANVAATGGLVNIAAAGLLEAVSVTTTPDNDANDIILSTTIGNIEVTTVTAGLGSASDVTLTANTAAGQSVVDANGAAANISADVLTIDVQGNIAAATADDDLDINANALDVASTNAGGIWINETNDLTVTGADTASGDVVLNVGASVTLDMSAADTMTVSGGDVTVNAELEILASGIPNGNSHIFTDGSVNLNTNGTTGQAIGEGPANAFPYSLPYRPIVFEDTLNELNISGRLTNGAFIMGNPGELALGTVNITGAISFDIYNGGTIYLTRDLTTNGAGISFVQPVRLRPTVGNQINIATSGGAVTFTGTLDDDDVAGPGTNILAINTTAGGLTFTGAVGSNDAPLGLDLTAGAVSIDGGMNLDANGLDVTHSGILDIADITNAADTATFDVISAGDVTSTGTGTATIAGDIRLTAGNLTFNRPVTLTGGVALESAGNLTVNNTLDGAQDLILDVAGAAQFNAAVGTGTPIGDGTGAALTVNSAGTTEFVSTLETAEGLNQDNAAGEITFRENVDINAGGTATAFNADLTLDGMTLTSAGAVSFGNAPGDILTLSTAAVAVDTSANNSTVTFAGDVLGNGINLTVDTGQSGGGTVNVLADLGQAGSRIGTLEIISDLINLGGSGIYSTGDQVYDTEPGDSGTPVADTEGTGTTLEFAANGAIDAGGSDIYFDDLYIDMTGITVTPANVGTIYTDRFTFFNGSLDLAAATPTIRTSDDFVVLGYALSNAIDDPERGPAVNEWEYPEMADFGAFDPGLPYTASFAGGPGLNGITLIVDSDGSAGPAGDDAGDFYVNGTDLAATANWTLTLPDNSASQPLTFGPWGRPYAVVLNSAVSRSQLGAGVTAVINAGGETAAGISTDGGNNTNYDFAAVYTQPSIANGYAAVATPAAGSGYYGWDFTQTDVESAAIVKDDLLRVTFNKPLINVNGELNSAVAGGLFVADPADDAVAFLQAFLDGDAAAGDSPVVDPVQDIAGRSDYMLKTIYLRLPAASNSSWRTDATGSAAPGAQNGGLGWASSTDSLGRRDLPAAATDFGDLIPDLRFIKGGVYGSGGGDYVIADEANSDDIFNLALDEAGPVLWRIEVGRADHAADTLVPADTADAHNYFRLFYSEDVAFGDSDGEAGAAAAAAGFSYDDAQPAAVYTDAELTLAADGELGGEIRHLSDGGAAVAEAVEVSGYFRYSNSQYSAQSDFHMIKGSRDGSPVTDTLRKNATNQLEIFLAARFDASTAGREHWPGWFFNALDPYGTDDDAIEVLRNNFISDRSANAIDYLDSTFSISTADNNYGPGVMDFTADPAATFDFWDVAAPGVSSFFVQSAPFIRGDFTPPASDWSQNHIPTTHEIIIGDQDSDQQMDRLELFIQDNFYAKPWDFVSSEDNSFADGTWNPNTEHPDTRTIADTGAAAAAVPRGVRDNSFGYSGTGAELEGFRIGVIGASHSDARAVADFTTQSFDTQIQNALFNRIIPNIISVRSDPYFSLNFEESDFSWNTEVELYMTYNASRGWVTDLAGNLMPSSGFTPSGAGDPFENLLTPARYSQNPFEDNLGESGKLIAIERTPPEILLTLGAVGGRRIFLQFTEPVFGSPALDEQIAANDFLFEDGSNSVVGIEFVDTNTDIGSVPGVESLYLILSNPLTPDMIMKTSIIEAAANGEIWDKAQNSYRDADRKPVSDVGIGIIEPVFATDGIQQDDSRGGGFTSLREFDGEGFLDDLDITLSASFVEDFPADLIDLPVNLLYDFSVADSFLSLLPGGGRGEFWSPVLVPALVTAPNTSARRASSLGVDGAIRDYRINAGDPEMQRGELLEFIFEVGNLPAATVDDPDDPLSLRPWRIAIGGIVEQRGGATILNNVINPDNGDQTVLNYRIDRPGMVVINVFTLDGDLVRILQRGRQGEGLYNIAWDGTNNSGDIVARGFYFIRIVAPGVDEVRKVLVVR